MTHYGIRTGKIFKATLLAGLLWLASARLAQAAGGEALQTSGIAPRPMTTIGKAFNDGSGLYLPNSGNDAATHREVTEWLEQYGNLTMLRSGYDGLGYDHVVSKPSGILFCYPGFDVRIAA